MNYIENKIMNYIEDLNISPSQLDVEWLEQPLLFYKYSAASADANRSVRKCEELVKTVRSQLILEAGQKGELYPGTGIKSTAVNVEAYFRNHSRYQEAKNTLNKALHEAEMLSNMVFSLHQRKTTLENLTRLQGQNYFAGPIVPRDLPQKYKEDQREGLRNKQREKTAQLMKMKSASIVVGAPEQPVDDGTPVRSRRSRRSRRDQ